MSSPVIDLTTAPVASPACVHKLDVALFKVEVEHPRVLAHAQNYIAYTLKSGTMLRLIRRSTNHKGTLRMDTVIHAAQFVNYQSNVLAVAAADAFAVAVVTEEPNEEEGGDLTVRVYFQVTDAAATIHAFRVFVNPAVKAPDVLVLYGSTAAVLESSRLIASFDGATTQEPTLAECCRELRALERPAAAAHSLCDASSYGWFAFTTTPTAAVACTMRNRATPAWEVCEGQPVAALALAEAPAAGGVAEFEGPAVLFAASAARVWQWRVTGSAEPAVLRSFSFGCGPAAAPVPVAALLASRDCVALFSGDRRAAVLRLGDGDAYDVTAYQLDFDVRRGGLCYFQNSANAVFLVDREKDKKMQQLQLNTRRAFEEREAEGGLAALRSKGPGASSSSGTAADDNPISRLVQQVERGQLRTNQQIAAQVAASKNAATVAATATALAPPGASVAAAKGGNNNNNNNNNNNGEDHSGHPAGVSSAAVAAPPPTPGMTAPRGVVLHNATLLQARDGPIAAAVYQSDVCVRDACEAAAETLRSLGKILEVAPTLLSGDVDELVSLALEAQMTEIAQTLGGRAAGGASANASPASFSSGGGNATAAARLGGGGSGGGAASGGGRLPVTAGVGVGANRPNRAAEDVFNSYGLTATMAPLATNLVSGIRRGLERVVLQELDGVVRAAVTEQLRRQQSRALQERLEEALRGSGEYYQQELRRRMSHFATRELREAVARANTHARRLAEENARLRAALASLMAAGTLDTVAELRAELQALRASIRSGSLSLAVANSGSNSGGANNNNSAAGNAAGAAGAAAARSSPETILSHAMNFIVARDNAAAGLEYIAGAEQPGLTVALLKQLPEEVYDRMIANSPEVPPRTWAAIARQLCHPAATTAAGTEIADTERVTDFLVDVLTENRRLLEGSSGPVQQLLTDIRHFITRARGVLHRQEFLNTLRDIEKIIQ